MGNKFYRQGPISLSLQLASLLSTYGTLIEESYIKNSVLFCTMRLTPSEESMTYRVLIKYKLSDYRPNVWLLEPQLQKNDDNFPEHLYLTKTDSFGHHCLCVFNPKIREWTRQMYLSKAFVPWIITWLSTYEFWLITGKWCYPSSSHSRKN